MRDSMIQGNWTDDRPPKSRVDWNNLAAKTRALNSQYPNPLPSHLAEQQDSEHTDSEDDWQEWPEAPLPEEPILTIDPYKPPSSAQGEAPDPYAGKDSPIDPYYADWVNRR
jgi:hypothetical protein